MGSLHGFTVMRFKYSRGLVKSIEVEMKEHYCVLRLVSWDGEYVHQYLMVNVHTFYVILMTQ